MILILHMGKKLGFVEPDSKKKREWLDEKESRREYGTGDKKQ